MPHPLCIRSACVKSSRGINVRLVWIFVRAESHCPGEERVCQRLRHNESIPSCLDSSAGNFDDHLENRVSIVSWITPDLLSCRHNYYISLNYFKQLGTLSSWRRRWHTRSIPRKWLFCTGKNSYRTNINTRTRLHVSTAHAQWVGLRRLQLPIKNGKVVGESYRCWRQLITFGLFFMKVGRKFILVDRNQYCIQDLWFSTVPTSLSIMVTDYRW